MRIPGHIPVSIHPFFWLFSALLGWVYGQSLLGMLIWIAIIFVSVIIHEYGHALTAVCFGQKARIQLLAFGGLTSYDGGPPLRFWQQFLIVLNGPLFGLGLCLLATAILRLPLLPLWYAIWKYVQVANFLWSAVNLLPVLPLDGGQLLRIALEGCFGIRGFRAALLTGAIIAACITGAAFIYSYFIAGAFFFLFAFQGFDAWRKSRLATKEDRSEGTTELMMQAESALKEGRNEEAKRLFTEIAQTHGMLSVAAKQYLAFFDLQEGKKEEAYQLLLPLKEYLAAESICLLHQLASEHTNDALVTDLSVKCYEIAPSQQVALSNARSFARLGQAKEAGGWLQTAWQHGPYSIEELLQEEPFIRMRSDPSFQEFIQPLLG